MLPQDNDNAPRAGEIAVWVETHPVDGRKLFVMTVTGYNMKLYMNAEMLDSYIDNLLTKRRELHE